MADLTDIDGVGSAFAEDFAEAGYPNVDDVANATEEELQEVDGVGPATAIDYIEAAQDVIRDDTLDSEEEEEHTDADDAVDDEVPDLEEGPEDDEDDVTLEDLEELNSEEPDEAPDSEVTAEDDDEEPEENEVVVEEFTFGVELEDENQYDYLLYALLDLRLGRITITHEQKRLSEGLLDKVRPLGGPGEIELTLTESELNALHAALTQTQTAYQGENAVEAFNAVRAVKEQVQAAREEFL